MAMTIVTSDTSETGAVFVLGNLAADGTVDIQMAARPDFAFCVCPIHNVARAAAVGFGGLNQSATLFVRCRARRADGRVEAWSNVDSFRTRDGAARDLSPAPVLIEPAVIVVPERPTQWISGQYVPGFPASNAGRDAPVPWKSPDFDTNPPYSYVDVKLSGAPIDTVAVLNTNMPEHGTIWIGAAPTREALDSGVDRQVPFNYTPFRATPNMPGRPGYHGLFRFGTVSTLPWWRIVLVGVKTGNMLWCEHIVFGKNRATKNHSIDKTETPIPKGSVERLRSGVPDRLAGLPMRKVEFDISMLTERQYEEAYGDLHLYENEPVLVVPNSKSGAFLHDRILYGDLKGGRSFNPASPRFTRSFTIESLI